jgi:hypothetical protein
VALAVGAAIGCSTVTPPPDSSATVGVSESTKGEIATVLRERYSALGRLDLAAYQATFDPTRLALRRCLMDDFEVVSRQGGLGAFDANFEVGRIEMYGSYVRAYVNEGLGFRRLYFRKDHSRWVQTEPTEAELGGAKTKTVDGLQIAYWGIDDDVIDVLAQASLSARAAVLQSLLGPQSREPFAIRFYPTRGVAGIVRCWLVGTALINNPGDPFIRFFQYGFDRTGAGLTPETISFIRHEGLHWAQDQYIPAIFVRLPWFLAEGWPDYIGQSRSVSELTHAVCGSPTPTFKELSDGAPPTPQELAGLYYAFANTMVEYLYLHFGKDAYPRLLTAYKDGVNADVNFPKVLRVTPMQFYDGWLAFAKKKYC